MRVASIIKFKIELRMLVKMAILPLFCRFSLRNKKRAKLSLHPF